MSSSDAVTIDLEKCRGLLLPGLSKIQQQHHNSLPLTTNGRNYLEELLLKLLASLLSSLPKNVQDAKEQVSRKFPEPLSKWALEEAEYAQEKGKKKVAFSVDKLHHALKEHNPGMEKQVTLIFSGVLEYMASDVLKLTTNYAKNILNNEITDQDIKIAMFADNVLMDVFHCDEMEEDMVIVPDFDSVNNNKAIKKNVSYTSLVRDFMSEEGSYLRDLNLIIKRIKKEFDTAYSDTKLFSEKDIDCVFSSVSDLAELTVKLIGLLEEVVEMTDETSPVPLVGNCFEDLALECSFDIYSDYTNAIMDEEWRTNFDEIVSRPAVTKHLQQVCQGFRDVVVFVLPNLLLAPIYHCFYYFEQIELFETTSPDNDDRQCLSQALSAITSIKPVLEARTQSLPKLRPSEANLRISWRGPTASKISDIEKSIDGWWGRPLTQSCNEFLYEGSLLRVGNKRTSARHVFLFDSLIISCKSNQARLPTVAASQFECRLKEKIFIRKATVKDIIDESGNSKNYQFEIYDCEKKETHLFQAKTMADKRAWMAHLVRLQHRSTFDRMLDKIIREEAANQVLRLPTPEQYRFAEPDSKLNLILDENNPDNENQAPKQSQVDVIKGGTVLKLVERLTYHLYTDQNFTKTFLTTFRSFCKPAELLDLLIERYQIPEPPPTEEQQLAIDRGELPIREDLKQFRKEYLAPIQLRVMNVIRQWLERHYYDFERDEKLLLDVEAFIGSVRGKNKKWARTMQKVIERKRKRKSGLEADYPEFSFNEEAPATEWHTTKVPAKFNFFTLHPIEIARQLTLIEFSLYRKVQPSEMIGSVWTKVGKEENSPNLLKMIHFSTKITRWVSKSIIEVANLEERLAAMCRVIEIMQVMQQLNNFNGLLEFVAAMNSSAVHRLNYTKENLPDRFSKILKECMDLCDSRLTNMMEKLRSIDPPCVPFVGSFLTNILKTEEGNPHLLPNQPEHLKLINFSKRRKVASIMFDVEQYQIERYNLIMVPPIRDFFLNLDPVAERTEKQFNDYLFNTSLKIEPREVDRPPKFPRQANLHDKDIKSPGIVPGKRHVSRTLTKEDLRSMVTDKPLRVVTRSNSSRLQNSEKRHSLITTPTQKRPSLDTMSVKSLAVLSLDSERTSYPKEEPPPPRPPREPRSQHTESKNDLVSAPPTVPYRSPFPFDMTSTRFGPSKIDPRNGPMSAVPPTPATAPPRTGPVHVMPMTPVVIPLRNMANGSQLDLDRISPPAAQLDLGDDKGDDLIPPPIPPRDKQISMNRYSPTPPPLPPRDPPYIPPRDPVRSIPPYSRNYDMQPSTPPVNGTFYPADPTWDLPPISHNRESNSTPHVFENFPPAPPYSERDPGVTPTAFAFPDMRHPNGTPPRDGWCGNNFMPLSGGEWSSNNGVPQPRADHQVLSNAVPLSRGEQSSNNGVSHFVSNDVPPPIPRRQPSSTTSCEKQDFTNY